jgi:hypothetical protein
MSFNLVFLFARRSKFIGEILINEREKLCYQKKNAHKNMKYKSLLKTSNRVAITCCHNVEEGKKRKKKKAQS